MLRGRGRSLWAACWKKWYDTKIGIGMFHLENSMSKDQGDPSPSLSHSIFPSITEYPLNSQSLVLFFPAAIPLTSSSQHIRLSSPFPSWLVTSHLTQFSQHQLSIVALLFIFPRIKNVSPAEAYQDFCLAFTGKKTLTHLTLEGSVHSEKMLLLLCETLKHLRCNLHYLR